jgi:Aspartyl protease
LKSFKSSILTLAMRVAGQEARVRYLALFMVFALAVAAPGSAAREVLPMLPYGVYPAVNVRVNGNGPYLFLIDTGANTKSRVDKSLAAALHLRTTGTETAGTAVSSATVEVQTLTLASLDVGNVRYHNVPSHIGSYNTPGEYLPDIGGILAFDLFDQQLLTLDFCRRQVIIEEGELPASARGVIPYEDRDGIPYVKGKLGAQELTLLFDTGTDRALDLPMDVLRTQFLASFPRPHGTSHGLGGETLGIGRVQLEDPLTIGTTKFSHIEATFSSVWKLPIIGSALLRRAVVTFDQKHKRMKIAQGRACRASN